MDYLSDHGELNFNSKPSTILHLDLNSCFATVEQQANPHLRGKPIAVAAYTTPNGCILAPSVEAKRFGVKTGMRVKDGKLLCPGLIILGSDPWKYRNVHLALRRLISDYTADFTAKSIDEFVLNLEGFPVLQKRIGELFQTSSRVPQASKERGDLISDTDCHVPFDYAQGPRNDNSSAMKGIGREIKERIKREIGDWLTVSVGIAPNRYLAKIAAGLHKPDGLDEINKVNFLSVYRGLGLTDLCGIKLANAGRLNSMGIFTVLDFYNADIRTLKAAFSSINGYYWYLRLRGWEIDDVEFGRRSYGNSYALPDPLATMEELSPILAKLVTKMGARLRHAGYSARGVHVAVGYRDSSFWHKGIGFEKELFDSRDIYKKAYRILSRSPYRKPVRDLALSCFDLIKSGAPQLELFDDIPKRRDLVTSIDKINERWGSFVITPARMLGTERKVPDRIAFGGVKELEEFTLTY